MAIPISGAEKIRSCRGRSLGVRRPRSGRWGSRIGPALRVLSRRARGATMGPQLRFNVMGDAWRLYQRRWSTRSVAMLIVLIAISLVGSALFPLFGERWPGGHGGFRLPTSPHEHALHYVGTVVVGGFFLGGMIRMASHQVLGRVPRIEDLFSVVDVGFQC